MQSGGRERRRRLGQKKSRKIWREKRTTDDVQMGKQWDGVFLDREGEGESVVPQKEDCWGEKRRETAGAARFQEVGRTAREEDKGKGEGKVRTEQKRNSGEEAGGEGGENDKRGQNEEDTEQRENRKPRMGKRTPNAKQDDGQKKRNKKIHV